MKKFACLFVCIFIAKTTIFAQSLQNNDTYSYFLNSGGSVAPFNLGIGTQNPLNKLSIEGNEQEWNNRVFLSLHNANTTGSSSVMINMTASDNHAKSGNISYAGSTYNILEDFDESFNITTNGKSLNFGSTGFIRMYIYDTSLEKPVEAARITQDGKFGIGTSNPTAKLHTVGMVRLQDLPSGSSFILTADSKGNVLKSSTLLTEMNAKIADLTIRLAAAEETINTLKKAIGTPNVGTEQASLFQNEPNPANEVTKIKFYAPTLVKKANIFVFDSNGKMTQQYQLEQITGNQEVSINANILEAGLYFYTLLFDGREIDTKKMFITQ